MTGHPDTGRHAVNRLSMSTPLGPIEIGERNGRIVSIDWGDRLGNAIATAATLVLRAAADQLHAYFHQGLTSFDLPLAPVGTDFQQQVWQELLTIPYGTTLSYGTLAERIRSVARAVGGACGRNPIPIIIPCHRVLAGAGRMGGFTGPNGLETKQHLLRIEGVLLPT